MRWTPAHTWALWELGRALNNAGLHRRGRAHSPRQFIRGRWRTVDPDPWPNTAACPKCQRTLSRVLAALGPLTQGLTQESPDTV